MESNHIKKYLNFELSPDEEEAFKKTKEYAKHQKTLELLQNSKAVSFDGKTLLENINSKKIATSKVIPLYKKWLPISIAASILLCFSMFYFYTTKPISHNTIVGESIRFSLPDESSVWLNAKSEISHNKDWEDSRDITLKGEAYFEVAKGKKFTVKTPQGIVTVLGTKFNVKQRDDFFEVHCFEGSVAVNYKGNKTILKASDLFSSKINNIQIKNIDKPNWIANKSVFRNTNLNDVLTDISLHYDIKFMETEGFISSPLKYTGSYNYDDDLETTLKVLCQSLNLKYDIKNKLIYLSTQE